jgi:Ca-activated chloride channel homolog
MDLGALHFIRPWWLLALIPVALLAVAWARRRAADSHWESSIAPELLKVLLEPGEGSTSRRLHWLVGAALAASVVGLAGPSWERLPQPVEQRTDALVIVLDLSLSMYAEDVAPSRVVRARQKVADVLRLRDEGFTALVAFAGSAHTVVPLTDDHRTIENLLPALEPEMMPVFGSNLGAALDLARELLENAGIRQGRILVVTDGIDRMSDATERRSQRFPISLLGVGTANGGTIPLDFADQPGQVLRSMAGEPILARLDEANLRSVADLTYGRYRTLELGDQDIEYLLGTRLPGEDDTIQVERDFDRWADMGFWVCILLIPVVLAAFRRGVVAAVPWLAAPLAALLLMPAPASAGVWDDLWQRRDQQAFQALREGEPEKAATLFGRPDWRAAALYRSGEFEAAADAYRRNPSVTARYNLGNALAHQGELARAIEAYEQVLAVAPQHEDAAFNKALLERLLQEQQSAEQNNDERQQQHDGQPDESTQSQGDNEPGDGEQDPGQPPGDADQESQPRDGDPSGSERGREGQQDLDELSSRDEQQEALDQWLRRVPDDPGGLLRRKFQYEANQRMRRGDYSQREAEKIW